LEREDFLKKIAGEIGISLEVLRGDLEKSLLRKGMSRKSPGIVSDKMDKGLCVKELAEKELLSSVLQDLVLNEELWNHLAPDLFTPGPMQKIAEGLHTLFQEQKEASVSILLGYFSQQEMHKLITEMATPLRRGEESKTRKRMNDCLRRLRALRWAEEREKLIKSIQEKNGVAEVSASLQRLQDLKAWEEELYRSVEGEKVDG
jgi:hypothetical protein